MQGEFAQALQENAMCTLANISGGLSSVISSLGESLESCTLDAQIVDTKEASASALMIYDDNAEKERLSKALLNSEEERERVVREAQNRAAEAENKLASTLERVAAERATYQKEYMDTLRKLEQQQQQHHHQQQRVGAEVDLKEKNVDCQIETTENDEILKLGKRLEDEVKQRGKLEEEIKSLKHQLLQLSFEADETRKVLDRGGSGRNSNGSDTAMNALKAHQVRDAANGQKATIAKLFEQVGLQKILSLLESEDVDVRVHAVKVVANLAAEEANQEKIVEAGGLSSLLMLLRSSEDETIRRVAAGAIANLAMNETNQELIMTQGGISLLSRTAEEAEDPQTLRMVSGAIANLCGNDKLQIKLRDEGGIRALLGMVRAGHPDVLAQVARGIANFAKYESRASTQGMKTGRSPLIDDGTLPWIVQNANNEASPIRRHIELALCHLAQHEVTAKDLIAGGALWELVRISRDCSREDIRNLAHRTLVSSPIFQTELQRLLFSLIKWDRQFLNEIIDNFLEREEDMLQYDQIEAGKVRAVTRMLMMPMRSEAGILRRKLATGPAHAPYEGLVISHQDRFLNNIGWLQSIYSFIPPVRAPPVDVVCSDRAFAYQKNGELHHPWMKRLFVGFARTSEFNGPARPPSPHHLIKDINSELSVQQPVMHLTNRIFGSSPPLQNFDPAKMLTDSGKLQTLDALLKRLRAGNHRVLLFAQMTKMLNILEDYMNYRKYRYLRLDGSSTIMDRRDMVRDFQTRSDIFVFLLSTRAGGLGINLTAADTVIFYESDWNPTLDLQAMDRAHRLGQTKEVTVYRLICKETVEEKILQRASQKNTVQQLVMTGGQAQGDVLAPEDVVSLLLDDAQLEQKIKEQAPKQGKERQRKKRGIPSGSKAIRLDAEGDACLEEFTNLLTGEDGNALEKAVEVENGKAGNGKRKRVDKKPPSKTRNSQKTAKDSEVSLEQKDPKQLKFDGDSKQKGRSGRRPKKGENDCQMTFVGGSAEQAAEPVDLSLYDASTNDVNVEMEEENSSRSWSSTR